jgi:hypothetical protein
MASSSGFEPSGLPIQIQQVGYLAGRERRKKCATVNNISFSLFTCRKEVGFFAHVGNEQPSFSSSPPRR